MKENASILGINAGHDSSVCLLKNGAVQYAVEEERLNRLKGFAGWPARALDSVPRQPVHVALANSREFWQQMQKRDLDFMFRKRGLANDPVNERSFRHDTGSRRSLDATSRVIHELESLGFRVLSISMWDHHLSHAASAYFTSGHPEVLAFTADGSGDFRSASVYRVKDGDFRLLGETLLPHSPGHMYGWMTKYLGFKASRHEGKLTGLAARGDLSDVLHQPAELLTYDPSSKSFTNPFIAQALGSGSIPALWSAFSSEVFRSLLRRRPFHTTNFALKRFLDSSPPLSREQYAALAQESLESAILAWVSQMCLTEELRHTVFAGGVFSNVALNQRISELNEIGDMWVFPNMGDGGLSVGAAFLRYRELLPVVADSHSAAIPDVYWGPECHELVIKDALLKAGVNFEYVSQPELVAAKALSNRQIVGWVQGRLEFGPRALGHRSLLAHPSDPSIALELNERLSRSDFMPFAPSVLTEYVTQIFPHASSAALRSGNFMTITMEVAASWRADLAAVVHIDGSARPQIVSREIQPQYWNLIEEFRLLTGIPAIINTSFNLHEEPIVSSAEDALLAFKRGACDVLVLGNFIVS